MKNKGNAGVRLNKFDFTDEQVEVLAGLSQLDVNLTAANGTAFTSEQKRDFFARQSELKEMFVAAALAIQQRRQPQTQEATKSAEHNT